MKESVYLIGCRAVGKSSVGAALARGIGYTFLDTDDLIVEKTGASVQCIVAEEGWPGFRKFEKQVLAELTGRKQLVVATGGGAILHREIWPELKNEAKVIWLTADIETLCRRLEKDHGPDSQRPSLTGKGICQELKDVLLERTPYYRETADYIVDSGELTPAMAVTAIKNYLEQNRPVEEKE